MKEYTKPELEVILFQTENICLGGIESGDDVPVIPDDEDE